MKHYLDRCEMVDKRLNWQVKEIIWRGTSQDFDNVASGLFNYSAIPVAF